MDLPHSDAFVFFGATGDLAYKQIFPALQALVRRGQLEAPIVGVGRSGWTVEKLIERARASIKEHGVYDEQAFGKLASLMRYVDGCARRWAMPACRCITSRSRRACSRPWSALWRLPNVPTMRAWCWRSRSAAICSRRAN
jgi:hypothetical protein